ncbi:hypothetical protein [Altericista sp. CCNU0014]|uniref:hypothetical protein n=1 Tax=Altericista sp. CCNU0014 TaxID=3082949 RepID=UPI00384D2DB4
MGCEQVEQELLQLTQEQKDEFCKLTLDFFVRNGLQKYIPHITIEIKQKPPSPTRDSIADFTCRDTPIPDPGDPCYPQIWAPG